MGTLTADVPRLPEHCDHKLPTSCRLTASPKCCACQDNRPHSAAYTVYVDGLGLVPRGTRWQNYCWFCKGLLGLFFFLIPGFVSFLAGGASQVARTGHIQAPPRRTPER
ncbi:hypothetical protein BDY21DRAFT_344027 [Lineolata rhizophorae]|uniref:Uncharacterized protein n=1 Tax=Lineolata rhizophorae TaxID=578093 RepID=A0A6A6P0F8_9PEZI|nr:hypothetical protein BDY21DRAFT_344027 [Lineolata rhizophorae]